MSEPWRWPCAAQATPASVNDFPRSGRRARARYAWTTHRWAVVPTCHARAYGGGRSGDVLGNLNPTQPPFTGLLLEKGMRSSTVRRRVQGN